MDDNKITSNDFDYDVYTGGSTNTDNVTSGNFDYDVYSGSSAMEYLRQENERKREERQRANKSAAELKREEYEKKFKGMSADDLFGMPEKKKKPEEDFSDFFDADEIQRQQEKLREFREKKDPLPKVENMMEGEDSPSSEPQDDKYKRGLEEANALLAQQRIRSDIQRERMEEYHRYGGFGGYSYRRGSAMRAYSLMTGRSPHEANEIDRAFSWYLISFIIGALLCYACDKVLFHIPVGLYLVGGAVFGALGSFVRHNGVDREPAGEAFSHCIFEIVAIFAALIAALIIEFA